MEAKEIAAYVKSTFRLRFLVSRLISHQWLKLILSLIVKCAVHYIRKSNIGENNYRVNVVG